MKGKEEVKMKETDLIDAIKLVYMHAWYDCEMQIISKQDIMIKVASTQELESKALEFAKTLVNEKA